jgi:hypothetical protein
MRGFDIVYFTRSFSGATTRCLGDSSPKNSDAELRRCDSVIAASFSLPGRSFRASCIISDALARQPAVDVKYGYLWDK